MSGSESQDFFNLDHPAEVKNAPSFSPEIDLLKNTPPINPNAAERVNVLPPGAKGARQAECGNTIMQACGWRNQEGSNQQSGTIGKIR